MKLCTFGFATEPQCLLWCFTETLPRGRTEGTFLRTPYQPKIAIRPALCCHCPVSWQAVARSYASSKQRRLGPWTRPFHVRCPWTAGRPWTQQWEMSVVRKWQEAQDPHRSNRGGFWEVLWPGVWCLKGCGAKGLIISHICVCVFGRGMMQRRGRRVTERGDK